MTKFEDMMAANPALKEAVEKGILRPPLVEGGSIPQGKPIAPLNELLRDLDEARADRV